MEKEIKTGRKVLQRTLPPSLHNLSHVFMKHSESLIMLASNEHLIVISHSFKLEGTIIFITAN